MPTRLLDAHTTLTPADQSTHRQYSFDVPADCTVLDIGVRYAPKALPADDSRRLAQAALADQAARLSAQLGAPDVADAWAADHADVVHNASIANLLTMSLDDAAGAYRGAGHRHAEDQHFLLTPHAASPGLVAGPLPPGRWTLTLSGHTLVSTQCVVAIQIGAETASSRP